MVWTDFKFYLYIAKSTKLLETIFNNITNKFDKSDIELIMQGNYKFLSNHFDWIKKLFEDQLFSNESMTDPKNVHAKSVEFANELAEFISNFFKFESSKKKAIYDIIFKVTRTSVPKLIWIVASVCNNDPHIFQQEFISWFVFYGSKIYTNLKIIFSNMVNSFFTQMVTKVIKVHFANEQNDNKLKYYEPLWNEWTKKACKFAKQYKCQYEIQQRYSSEETFLYNIDEVQHLFSGMFLYQSVLSVRNMIKYVQFVQFFRILAHDNYFFLDIFRLFGLIP